MCPECGKKETVLQSLTSDQWECRPMLGGCGAVFNAVARESPEREGRVEDAVRAMTDAIRKFEHGDCPLGRPSLIDMERRTTALLEVLKTEIARLVTVIGDTAPSTENA